MGFIAICVLICVAVFAFFYWLLEDVAFGVFIAFIAFMITFGFWGLSTDHSTRILLRRDQYEILLSKSFAEFVFRKDIKVTNDSYEIVSNADKAKVYLTTNFDHYGGQSYQLEVVL